jgi:hypothetical protein
MQDDNQQPTQGGTDMPVQEPQPPVTDQSQGDAPMDTPMGTPTPEPTTEGTGEEPTGEQKPEGEEVPQGDGNTTGGQA